VNINREFSLKSSKIIYDITSFTHLDYPDHLAAIFWFSSCNMRCDYCYNPKIVFAKNSKYSLMDALDFLKTRVGLLDAVVLSGGEATLHNLLDFIQEIKKLGFLIKLDTNGTNYKNIKELLDLNLLDFIALDYKAPKYKFLQITHSNQYEEFSKTLNLLLKNNFEFEVRTTLHYDLLNEDDINHIIKDLTARGYTNRYYLQKFREGQSNIGNLQNPQTDFNPKLLSKELKIVWR
jgi:pyruvate formate lyase activating enzyme